MKPKRKLCTSGVVFMEWLLPIGRIVFRGFLVFNDVNCFVNLRMMAGDAGVQKDTEPENCGGGERGDAGGRRFVGRARFFVRDRPDLYNFVSVTRELRHTRLLGGGRRTEDERAEHL